jgi:hypothetical protein
LAEWEGEKAVRIATKTKAVVVVAVIIHRYLTPGVGIDAEPPEEDATRKLE